MSSLPGMAVAGTPLMTLPPEYRIDIDATFQRLGSVTHYELLGVAPTADRQAILTACALRLKRVNPPIPDRDIPQEYRDRIAKITAALETAQATLTDAMKRFHYDQALTAQAAQAAAPRELPRSQRAQEATASSFVSAVQRASTSTTPAGSTPSVSSHPPETVRQPSGVVSLVAVPLAPVRPSTSYLPPPEPVGVPHPSGGAMVVPPPLRRSSSANPSSPVASSESATTPRSTPSPYPPSSNVDSRLASLEARFAESQGELSALLADLERVTAATQLCLAQLSEQSGPHQNQMLAALQALSGTRATVAAMLARREELAGRWEAASQLWQRAARSRPNDPHLLVRAAETIRRACGDLAVSESLARQALELSPNNPDARSVLSALGVRR